MTESETKLLAALEEWRTRDHEDAITLSRSDICTLLNALARRGAEAAARIEKLEKALRPFAQEAEGRDLEVDAEPLFEVPQIGATKVTLGDCRRAREVIAEAPSTGAA